MVPCKCCKATRLYCFVHKVPVCGDCICLPEHSTCVQVKTYSEWIVDSSYEFSPKCSLCLQTLNNTNDQVIRLSCLHILHASCLLLLLQRPPLSATGYTCPLCVAEIWPPNQHLASSDSLLCKRIEEVLFKGHSTILNSNSDAFLQIALEPAPNLSESFIVSDQGISGPVVPPQTVVFSSLTSGAMLNADQDLPKMHVKNYIHNNRGLSVENGEKHFISSSMIDIEAADVNSTDIITAKALGSPKLTKVLSRKISNRSDRRTDDSFVEDDAGKGWKHTPKGPQTELFESLLPRSLPAKPILPIKSPTQKNASDSQSLHDSVDGRWRRCRRATLFDPRKILFILATLSSVGTMILIYFTLTISKSGEDSVQVEPQ